MQPRETRCGRLRSCKTTGVTLNMPQNVSDFNLGAPTSVSIRTVRRTVIHMCVRNRWPSHVLWLTARHKAIRLAWARGVYHYIYKMLEWFIVFKFKHLTKSNWFFFCLGGLGGLDFILLYCSRHHQVYNPRRNQMISFSQQFHRMTLFHFLDLLFPFNFIRMFSLWFLQGTYWYVSNYSTWCCINLPHPAIFRFN